MTPTHTERCLSVIVPVYNEVNTILLVIQRIEAAPYVKEIILKNLFLLQPLGL
jgi:hypothetical protein